jgi:hypothetical protein
VIEPAWLLFGLLLPGLLGAAVVFAVTAGGNGETKPGVVKRAVLPIGLALAAAAGILTLVGLPPWKPLQGQHWLLMAVLPAAVMVAVIGSIDRIPRIVAWILRVVIAAATAPLLTRPLVPYTWSQTEAYAWWSGLGLWIAVSWVLLYVFARRGNGRMAVFVLGLTCGALGGITMASGYLAGGQYAASFALMLCGAWVAMLTRRHSDRFGAAIVDLSMAPLFGMLIYNWQFGWTMQHDAAPHLVAALLGLAPLGVCLCCLTTTAATTSKKRIVMGLLLSGVLILSAAGLAGYEALLRVQASSAYPGTARAGVPNRGLLRLGVPEHGGDRIERAQPPVPGPTDARTFADRPSGRPGFLLLRPQISK